MTAAKTHTSALIGDQRIEIDYVTNYHFDPDVEVLCLFYVSGKGAGAMYRAHLDRATASLPSAKLLRFLLENISGSRRIKLIRSFALAK